MNGNEKMEESCRLCDENGDQMFSVFGKNDEGVQILELIKECLPIIIYRTDPLPKHICESCHHNVNMLYKFKKAVQETAERQREKLQSQMDQPEPPMNVRLFLACGEDTEDGSELKDAATATDDLKLFCSNCKQPVNGAPNEELEICIAESLGKDKTDKLRRRKVVPFYHEPDDSLCSSLTEYTQKTEGSQCGYSDVESMESDEAQNGERPHKRPRMESEEREEPTQDTNKDKRIKAKKDQDQIGDSDRLKGLLKNEEDYRYQPLSLLQLTLNLINKTILTDYDTEHYVLERFYPQCLECEQNFPNLKSLAVHHAEHLDVLVGEKVDNPTLWPASKPDSKVRNKWLSYFDENGYDDEDIVIDNQEVVSTECLLVPVVPKQEKEERVVEEELVDVASTAGVGSTEKIILDGSQPMVNGIYLGDYSKEERKQFYQSMRIQGVNKKYCELCRYIFKDNWAIESHYFSSACYYTCRYCGMRFNKQRHKFNEHMEMHKQNGDSLSDKVYAASKLSNIVPKIIHPPKEKAKKIIVTTHNEVPSGTSSTGGGGSAQYHSIRVRNLMERRSLQASVKIKEEPQEVPPPPPPPLKENPMQNKTGNQAYFCRKCYKVFFKLDEFNVHSTKCDYNQSPQMRNSFSGKPTPKNGEAVVTPAGRPMRHCAKEAGPYKDEVYLPESILKEGKSNPNAFICFICNTPFPTIYSRNSHMRIHKGDMPPAPPFRPAPQQPHRSNFTQQNNYRSQAVAKQQQSYNRDKVVIKQEPMDTTMEPMVEIHETEQNTTFPETIGDGAVSITPISKSGKQPKPSVSSSIMQMVQNNPQLSISKKVGGAPTSQASSGGGGGNFQDDKTYKCSSCWEAFANKSHLYFHKKNQCEGSRLPCPFCKKRFGTEAEYSSHIYYSHPE